MKKRKLLTVALMATICGVSGQSVFAQSYTERQTVSSGEEKTYSGDTFTVTGGTLNGGALYNEGSVVSDNSTFTNNSTTGHGGAIFSNGNLSIKNNSSLTEGSANRAGAIYMNGGVLSVIDSVISSNTASGAGGAVYLSSGSSVGFNFSNATFEANTANTQGGAIYTEAAKESSISNSIFKNNISNKNGGAIRNNGAGLLTISGNTSFTGNKVMNSGYSGGAIYNAANGSVAIKDNVSISSNKADCGAGIYNAGKMDILGETLVSSNTYSAGGGGGIYNHNGTLNIYEQASLTTNYSPLGGGIYNNKGKVNLSGNAKVGSNYAESGAGLFNYGGTVNISDNAKITSNSAFDYAGGGVFNQDGATLNIFGNTEISSNSAASGIQYGYGGAIYNSSSTVNIYDNVKFNQNSANFGGAIYNINDGIINISGSTEFTQNQKTSNTQDSLTFVSQGGAIYNENGTVDISGTTKFIQNMATKGSAIYNADKMTISGDSTFSQNAFVAGANSYGGAIYNAGKLTIAENSEFIQNDATYGGALYNDENAVLKITGNSKFESNSPFSSATDGGAIYNKGTLAITGAEFKSNSASGNGGAIYNAGTLTIGDNANFEGNSAKMGGAIANYGATAVLNIGDNATFTDNYLTGSDKHGSAIYNKKGTVNVGDGLTLTKSELGNSHDCGIYSNEGGTVNIGDNFTVNNFHEAIVVAGSGNLINIGDNLHITNGGKGLNIWGDGISTNTIGANATFDNNYGRVFEIKDYATEGTTLTIGDNLVVRNNHNLESDYFGNVYNSSNSAMIFGGTSLFENNTTQKVGGNAGVFQNWGTLAFNGEATFKGNAANGVAGALRNRGAASNTVFNDNAIFSSNKAVENGGAIINEGAIAFNRNATFEGNVAGAVKSYVQDDYFGIYDAEGNYAPSDANTFYRLVLGDLDTSTSASGGAIHNTGSITYGSDVSFTGNEAASGGAIYNTGEISFNSNATFKNNTAVQAGNDIYNTGTLNFNAADGVTNTISLGGGIDGTVAGIINVAGTGTNKTGIIDLTGNVHNQTVNVNSGTLHLSAGTTDGSNLTGSTVNVKDGSILNSIDGVINIYTGKISLESGSIVKSEVNLVSGGTSSVDVYSATGDINVGGITVLQDFESGGESATVVIAQGATNVIADNVKAYTSNGTYSVTGSTDSSGTITINKTANGGLNVAVKETDNTTPEIVTYNVTADEKYYSVATTADTTVQNADFTIQGNGNTITADNGTTTTQGIIVAANSEVKIENATLADFQHTNGAVYNQGTLTLDGVTIGSDNTLGLKNEGNATITETSNISSIINDGNISMKIIDYVEKEQDVNTLITNSTSTSIGNTSIDLQLSDHSATESDGVNWNIASSGIVQNSITFTGDGHLMLKGGDITADVINKMTGNTLVVNNKIAGNFVNNSADSHAQFATGAEITGTITNDGLLDIIADNFDIQNGILQTAVNKGTLNIGDGTNSTNVTISSGSIAQNELNILNNATLTTDLSQLAIHSGSIANSGNLILTDNDAGTLTYNITGSTGITDFDMGSSNTLVYDVTAKSIENTVKLTSGTLNAKNTTNGDISFTGVIANGGTLSVQDNLMGAIDLGKLDLTNANLNLEIDSDLNSLNPTYGADVLSATEVTGLNKINISNLNVSDYAAGFDVNIADTVTREYVDMTNTTISGATSSLMFSYSTTTGNITGDAAVDTVEKAIKSEVDTKVYAMTADETFTDDADVTLKGSSLSVSADSNTITGQGHDIIIDKEEQTLSFTGDGTNTTLTNFGTAIDNTAGGTVNLTDVVMTGNTTDVNNNGTLNLAGDTTLETVTGEGKTNITDGTTTIAANNSITQSNVNVTDSATLQNAGTVDADVNNSGTLINAAGASINGDVTNSGIFDNSSDYTGSLNNSGIISDTGSTGTLTLNGTSSNTGSITQTTVTNNDTFNNSGSITANVINNSILNDSSTASYNGDVTNNGTWNANPDAINSVTGDVTLADGSVLNLSNGANDTITKPIIVEADKIADLKIDLDVVTGESDKFTGGVTGGKVAFTDIGLNGKISSSQYNGWSVDLENATGIAKANIANGKINGTLLTPIRYLQGSVQDALLAYTPTGGRNDYESFNPAVVTSEVASQVAYLSQLNNYDQSFANMDMYMLMTKKERQAMKFQNKYAAMDGDYVYDPTMKQFENKAGWFRPYANFENVPLKNGPRISNVMYGTYLGGDSPMYDLGNGWDGVFSIYANYNGSHQTYQGNSIYQNGGGIGLTGVAYKGNFFGGLTANVGSVIADAKNMYGNEDFAMLMTGVAGKIGYNWELADGKFIIQPNYQMSYSFINTFDYNNAAGVKIKSNPLHAITFEPGVKFIGNLPHGWQPYAGVSVVANILDQNNVKANDVGLPEMSVKPYAKYGVGVRKKWGERLTGFIQTFFTSGGRNGIGFQLGLRWTLGKSEANKAKKTSNKMPEKTKTNFNIKNV